jgi:hypothetical protein
MGEWKYSFTILDLATIREVSDQLHAPGSLTPGTPCIGGWVGFGAGLDVIERKKI